MKVLLQNIKTGKRSIGEVPYPQVKSGRILVENQFSAISIGTEKMITELASMNYLQKARSRPDDVKKILRKIRQEGLFPTVKTVMNKLDEPFVLGYSASGIVAGVSPEIGEFTIGDRVAVSGGGFVYHSEACLVPVNLTVKIPENVDMQDASLATIAAIGIQGMRIADIHPGEFVCVIGLGLLGLLTSQILIASGCRVVGIEPDALRRQIANNIGVEKTFIPDDDSDNIFNYANGRGFDKVIITASTKSNKPVIMAGEIARDRAIISSVGLTGMEIPRTLYYMKELDFRISRSYGAGRYDKVYEEQGIDYPIGYVRWTEKRNMEFYLDLLNSKKIDVKPLISKVYEFDNALQAYNDILSKKGNELIGVLFKYNKNINKEETIIINGTYQKNDKISIGIIGAGNFVKSIIIPFIKGTNKYNFIGICDRVGTASAYLAKRYKFSYATTDYKKIINDESINLVIVATSHSSHAKLIEESMKAGKDVYCEKPPAVNRKEMEQLIKTIKQTGRRLYIGYNRRFSPHMTKIKGILNNVQKPYHIEYRMNAGFIPKDHWANSKSEGGRIIGEGCHIFDLFMYLINSPIKDVKWSQPTGNRENIAFENEATVTFMYEDGSVATLIYTALGTTNYPKETMTVFAGGNVIEMNNYRKTKFYTNDKIKEFNTNSVEKGFKEAYKELGKSIIEGRAFPIPLWHIVEFKKMMR